MAALLLTCLNTASHAADKIPIADFLRDIRNQFRSMQLQQEGSPAPVIVSNFHVEMNVIADRDENGNVAYFVLEGQAGAGEVVTQKLSFDLEFLQPPTMQTGQARYRSYSTRRRQHTDAPDRYSREYPYPYHPGQYMPEINPVILFDRGR